jgi:thiamine kinase-like enzyme
MKLYQHITQLLDKAGLNSQIHDLVNCTKGGNNRTYKVTTRDGDFAVKQYFRRPEDKRDRLAAEFAFLSYANQAAPGKVPQTYVYDAENGLALYEFVQGQALRSENISAFEINQASEFFCALNDTQHKSQAQALPEASEACFSIQGHLHLITQRIAELEQFTPASQEDDLAHELIAELKQSWQKNLAGIAKIMQEKNIDLAAEINPEDRCISPSDFGFHNALRTPSGDIRFLDFEYAGWDDPAKMVGDFFSQLAVPVRDEFFDSFVDAILSPFKNKQDLKQRAELLRIVYQVKWCCIALNIFLPVHLARRQFANPDIDIAALKKAQIKKAESLLRKL